MHKRTKAVKINQILQAETCSQAVKYGCVGDPFVLQERLFRYDKPHNCRVWLHQSKLQEIRISKYAVPHNVSVCLKNEAYFQEAIIKILSAL